MAGDPLLQATTALEGLAHYWWPLCRTLALFATAPGFGHRALGIRARALLALVLTAALGGILPVSPELAPLSAPGVLAALEQIAVGVLLGLSLQLVFAVFSLVGDLVSTLLGLSMAVYNDPVNGVSSSSAIYQLYFILLMLLFLAIDGHLLVVSVLYKSFLYWPVGSGLHYAGMDALLSGLGWMFAAALLIALPMVVCMSLVQFGFGLLNRISPALNLFSLGFPAAVVIGLACLSLTLANLPGNYLELTRQTLDSLGNLLQEARNG